eukprot:1189521-Prorocentrum_minimum.AAC.1
MQRFAPRSLMTWHGHPIVRAHGRGPVGLLPGGGPRTGGRGAMCQRQPGLHGGHLGGGDCRGQRAQGRRVQPAPDARIHAAGSRGRGRP